MESVIGVALTNSSKLTLPARAIRVQSRQPNWKPKYTFTICPGVLHSNLSRMEDIVQYVEVNSIFGAEFVTFFNHSASPVLDPILNFYKSCGLVDVVQWKLPVKATKVHAEADIYYFAQASQMAECQYRAYISSKYVGYFDIDEVIVPKKGRKWLDFIPTDPQYGAYIIDHSRACIKQCKPNGNYTNMAASKYL